MAKKQSARSDLRTTGISLSPQSRAAVTQELSLVLADLFDLYSQCKYAHWNVRGESFYSLHLFFDSLADVAEGPIDDVAERIVTLGAAASGTVRSAANTSRLEEIRPGNFLSQLSARFAAAANHCRDGIDICDGAGDANSADLLTGISRSLDKAVWMIEAHGN